MRSSGLAPSRAVEPSARYHRSDADDAHGAVLKPCGPLICCSTATSPPSNSTRAAAYGAATTSARRADARARAGTSSGTTLASPSLGTTRIVPFSGRSLGFATWTMASATTPSVPSARDVPPAQNHDDDSEVDG